MKVITSGAKARCILGRKGRMVTRTFPRYLSFPANHGYASGGPLRKGAAMSRQISMFMLVAPLLLATAGCQLHPRPTDMGPDTLPPAPTPALPYHISDMRMQTLP